MFVRLSAPTGALVAAILLSGLTASSGRAETCLQRFSCKLYGECRLPCLDDVLGTRPAAPDAANPEAQGSPVTGREVAGAAKVAHHPKAAYHANRSPRLAVARDIGSVEKLAGKPVSFGPNGSPSQAVGRKLFARLGIKVAETPLDLDNALDGVATGDVAAVLLARPRDLARVGKASSSGDVHVLDVPQGAVAQGG